MPSFVLEVVRTNCKAQQRGGRSFGMIWYRKQINHSTHSTCGGHRKKTAVHKLHAECTLHTRYAIFGNDCHSFPYWYNTLIQSTL